jgi:cation transport ATPase
LQYRLLNPEYEYCRCYHYLLFLSVIQLQENVEHKMMNLESEGKTVMILATTQDNIAGLVAVADTLKETSKFNIKKVTAPRILPS